jgi:tRNA pseudouridine13 synthase
MTTTTPDTLPRALFRCSPEDFLVEELPAYAPSGRGEHLFVTFRKTGLNTLDVVRQIAELLGVDTRGAGIAGMKDRHAVTTQTASFPVPMARDPSPLLASARVPGVEILSFARHENKLKPGHLEGNRFRIVLRGLDDEGAAVVRAKLEQVANEGVPNAFGPQRFGRDGDNPERALAWIRGEARGPKDRREQRLIFSALQSRMFNEVLAQREQDGTWNRVLPGDLAKKHDTGGLFLVPAEGPELDDAIARAHAGGISPTGPMFGARMRWPSPSSAPYELERRVLESTLGDPGRLDAFRHLGEGTRRPLRMMVTNITTEPLGLTQTGNSVAVCFVLPKGGYATTVLARACRLEETRGGAREDDPGADAASAGDDGADAALS